MKSTSGPATAAPLLRTDEAHARLAVDSRDATFDFDLCPLHAGVLPAKDTPRPEKKRPEHGGSAKSAAGEHEPYVGGARVQFAFECESKDSTPSLLAAPFRETKSKAADPPF